MLPVPRVLYNGQVSDVIFCYKQEQVFSSVPDIKNVPCDFIDSIKEYWWQIFTTYLQEANLEHFFSKPQIHTLGLPSNIHNLVRSS